MRDVDPVPPPRVRDLYYALHSHAAHSHAASATGTRPIHTMFVFCCVRGGGTNNRQPKQRERDTHTIGEKYVECNDTTKHMGQCHVSRGNTICARVWQILHLLSTYGHTHAQGPPTRPRLTPVYKFLHTQAVRYLPRVR